MSAFPRDPEHFFRWVRNHHDRDAQPQDFIPRRVYGDYIHSLLQTASEYPGNARLERREEAVVGIARRKDRFTVRLSSGQTIVARAVVLATGSSPGIDWAPAGLSSADVADPWTDEPPDGDLLLVGTGPTMVDVAIAADRPGRGCTRSAARPGPRGARVATTPMVPPPRITRIGTLEELQRVVDADIERTIEETGDWARGVDGLRPVTAQRGRASPRTTALVSSRRSAERGDRLGPDVAVDGWRWDDRRLWPTCTHRQVGASR